MYILIRIPKENIKYIFERFFRVNISRSRSTGGIGVELTISKAIVNPHNRTIHVESELGIGSEFIITLPANKRL